MKLIRIILSTNGQKFNIMTLLQKGSNTQIHIRKWDKLLKKDNKLPTNCHLLVTNDGKIAPKWEENSRILINRVIAVESNIIKIYCQARSNKDFCPMRNRHQMFQGILEILCVSYSTPKGVIEPGNLDITHDGQGFIGLCTQPINKLTGYN